MSALRASMDDDHHAGMNAEQSQRHRGAPSRERRSGEGSGGSSNARSQARGSAGGSYDETMTLLQDAEDGETFDADDRPMRSQHRHQRHQRPPLATLRRTSSQGPSRRADDARRSSSIPLAPPTLESEGLYDDVVDGGYRSDSASGREDAVQGGGDQAITPENVLGGWHFAPLLIAILPPIGAVLGGHSDAWSDAILLALASFWLYQFLKVPHDIYHAARTRRILHVDAMTAEESASASSGPAELTAHEVEVARRRKREQASAAAELRRAELMSLVALILSPLAGAWLLTWMMETFTDGNRYLNKFNIRLFMLASGIKPWSHALSLFRRRLLHLQEVVHYPSSRVEDLTRRLFRLESELSTLRKLVATKTDVSMLRDGIDLPLTQLSRSMRRYERKEETLRMSAEDKFSFVEARLEDLLREVAINAELIEEERRERQRTASLPASIFQAIKYALGQRSRDYYDHDYDSSRGITHRTSLGIQAAPENMAGTVSSMMPTSSTLSQGSTSSISSGESLPDLNVPGHGAQQEGGASHVLPPYMQQSLQRSVMRASGAPAAGWTEEGLAYWVFWPINLPRSFLRTALSYASGSTTKQPRAGLRQQPPLIANPISSPVREIRQGSLRNSFAPRNPGAPASPTGGSQHISSPQPPVPTSKSQRHGAGGASSTSGGKLPPRLRTGGNGSGSTTHANGEVLTAGASLYGRRF